MLAKPNRRRWALGVLIVWLFGVAMGIANACALGDAAAEHAAGGTDALSQESTADPLTHGEHGAPAKANCLDACEKASLGVLKSKPGGDDSAASAVLAPPAAGLSPVAAATASPAARDIDRPARHGGRPFRVVYARLAL